MAEAQQGQACSLLPAPKDERKVSDVQGSEGRRNDSRSASMNGLEVGGCKGPEGWGI